MLCILRVAHSQISEILILNFNNLEMHLQPTVDLTLAKTMNSA